MESKIEHVLTQMKSIFDFDIMRRVFFFAGIAASVAVGFGINQWVQEPIYRSLDITANDKNLSSIIDVLDNENIKYKLNESSGIISVPATDINKARIKLSSAGIQKEDSFNFSFLNDKNKLGSSQFLENARYLRALEDDLAKSIVLIRGISSAVVHIAKPAKNVFADEYAKTTASVLINVAPGYDGDKEKIRAIIQLVAASVPELDPTMVAITDQYGHYLSSTVNLDDMQNQEHLAYQHKLDRDYEKRIHALILPILGENKASISVNTEVDFTQQEEAKEHFDPEQTVTRSEQTVNESNGTGGAAGVPGSLSNQAPANKQQQQPSSGDGQSKSEITKNYEISKSTRYVKSGSPIIQRISVAVVLDNDSVLDEKTQKMTSKPIEKEKLDKITALVKSSIGYKESRGDQVTVVNSGFIHPKVEVYKEPGFWEEPWFWDLFKKLAGIILGFAFLFIVYRKIVSELKLKSKNDGVAKIAVDKQNLISAEMIRLKTEQIEVLKDMVAKDPNKVVGVIKKWVAK